MPHPYLDFEGREPSIRELEDAERYLKIAKEKALDWVQKGDLKAAIDSMVSDLSKAPHRSAAKKELSTRMGLVLRNKADLSEEDVVEFISGWH